jgi:hypothetical protein
VGGVSHLDLRAGVSNGSRDFLALGCDDAAIGDAKLLHTLPDSNDEGESGEEAKGFAGEARRAQAGWDDGQRSHSVRRGGRPAAKCTPRNLRFRAR